MLDIQLGRRNLSPIQRIAVAEKYRPIYEKQAKKNMSLGGGDKKSGSQNSSKPINPENKIDVRAKLAKTAGVSAKKINAMNRKLTHQLFSKNLTVNERMTMVDNWKEEVGIENERK